MANVLIVEPSSDLAELLQTVVAGIGHEPLLEIGTPAEEIDALIVETGFPRGLDTARTVRRVRPDLPILIVSIFGRAPEVLALRPSCWIVKPFRLAELENALRDALGSGEDPG